MHKVATAIELGKGSHNDQAAALGAAESEALSAHVSFNHRVQAHMKTIGRQLPLSTGICKDCDGKIDDKYLEQFPYAQRCAECKKKHKVVFTGE